LDVYLVGDDYAAAVQRNDAGADAEVAAVDGGSRLKPGGREFGNLQRVGGDVRDQADAVSSA
jgi:hypothetical protein